MVRSLPIDAQKVTFHDGFISLKQAFEKLESVSTYKIAIGCVEKGLDGSKRNGSLVGLIAIVKEYGVHI